MVQAQKLASNPDYSVWVAASAGTGKTKVLTDRVLRLLLDGVEPGKILCITFTKAAASEMANRVNAQLGDWVTCPDEQLIAKLIELTSDTTIKVGDDKFNKARQLFLEVIDTPDGLKIQTIHSFCQNLMRKFPLEAGIAPHFQVIDDKTSDKLLKESRVGLLSEASHNQVLGNSVENISWRVHENSFNEIVEEFIAGRDRVYKLINNFSLDELEDATYKLLGIDASANLDAIEKDFCEGYLEKLDFVCDLLEQGSKTDMERAIAIRQWIKSDFTFRKSNIASYLRVYLTSTDEPRKKLATDGTVAKSPIIKEILLQEQQRVLDYIDIRKSIITAGLTVDLLRVAGTILNKYEFAKNTRSYLDYSDLIANSSKLLSNIEIGSWVLYKLDGGLDHLLVDEAQDTSFEQWQVIKALSEEFFVGHTARDENRTIFVVGDEKQSIFGFQGADPKMFSVMHKDFADKSKLANKGWQTVALDKSFRSTPAVLKLVDKVFSDPVLKSAVTYQEKPIHHVPFREDYFGRVELWPLQEKEEKIQYENWPLPDKYLESQTPSHDLAENIASTIKEWIDNKRFLPSKGRAVKASDIMILVRRRNELVDYLVSSLKKRGIPVAGVDRMILNDHLAIGDLVALGNFLLLPQDDLNLAGLLKSPLFNINEEQLFELAYNRGKKSLWQNLKINSEQKPEIYQNIHQYLHGLLAKVDYQTPFELFSDVVEAKKGREKFMARLGEEVNDPLDEFLTLAFDYEQSNPPSLQGFLNWFAYGKTEIKRDLDQGQEELRIMTVHGSKGLQAPIVFLPDTTSLPNSNPNILWNESVGDKEGKELLIWNAKKEYETTIATNLKSDIKQNEYREYLRLLYVALTRPEDELYICGSTTSKNVDGRCWYNIVKNSLVAEVEEGEGKLVIESAGDNDNIKSDKKKEISSDAVKKNIEADAIKTLPDFVFKKPKKEKDTQIPLAPSLIVEDNTAVEGYSSENNILRGKVVHTLLQFLPCVSVDNREDKMEKYLAKFTSGELNDEQKKQIKNNVLSVLSDSKNKDLFGRNSKAEVPICGIVDDYVISGQIDRLVVTQDQVIIIDYKTNRIPPKDISGVSKSYIKQLECYGKLVGNIYPEKQVKKYILWVENGVMMEVI